jgi:flavin-dependent thymidylate synthase
MKVELIAATPNALEVLIFTKSTRLKMSSTAFRDVLEWPMDKKLVELEYMKGTIASSFEFVDYIFMIEGVSRAFTHQLVRHRAGTAFAQQSMRTVDMEGFQFVEGPTVRVNENNDVGQRNRNDFYRAAMHTVDSYYQELKRLGAANDDARGILPTNICTNIGFKANLRTLAEMGLKRLCVKTQGEFQDVMKLMRNEVYKVHPWADGIIEVHCAKYGTCMFPNHPTTACAVKPFVFNPETGHAWDGRAPYPVHKLRQIWEKEYS